MTTWLFVSVTALVAGLDWWAVARDRSRLEEICKPLVMVGLFCVALQVGEPPNVVRAFMVLGLLFGLLGDVLLLPRVDRFIGGLAAFLVGHVAYVVALAGMGSGVVLGLVGLVVGAVMLGLVGARVVKGVAGTALVGPVVAYNLVIGAMVVAAFASGNAVAIVGALAFAASDSILGMDRFVWEGPGHRIYVMVLYHLGQAGLVASLLTA